MGGRCTGVTWRWLKACLAAGAACGLAIGLAACSTPGGRRGSGPVMLPEASPGYAGAQHGERRAQLMRGIGEEALLLADALLHAFEHAIDRLDKGRDLGG